MEEPETSPDPYVFSTMAAMLSGACLTSALTNNWGWGAFLYAPALVVLSLLEVAALLYFLKKGAPRPASALMATAAAVALTAAIVGLNRASGC